MTIDDQIEVSPEMIEAGMNVLDVLHYMDDQSDMPGDLYLISFQHEFVAAVYRAMRKASDQEATRMRQVTDL